mmetsp:Transcript_13533/g.21147  ORF Transcript_13533/g.21147 Transcript_13533/m.21147 type:complete len:86 (-) Transcript_13533:2018-2275(-)
MLGSSAKMDRNCYPCCGSFHAWAGFLTDKVEREGCSQPCDAPKLRNLPDHCTLVHRALEKCVTCYGGGVFNSSIAPVKLSTLQIG